MESTGNLLKVAIVSAALGVALLLGWMWSQPGVDDLQAPAVTSPSSVSADPYAQVKLDIISKFSTHVEPLLTTALKHYATDASYPLQRFPLPRKQYAVFVDRVQRFLLDSIHLEQEEDVRDVYEVEVVGEVSVHGANYQLVLIHLSPTGDRIPAAICLPAGGNAVPGIAVFSGHSSNGLLDLMVRRDSYQKALATFLCESGYAVIALEKIDSGLMSLNSAKDARQGGEDEDLLALLLYGSHYSIAARQLLAALVSVDLLARSARVDSTRIGAAGVSLGGWIALQAGIVSPRIKAIADFGRKVLFIEPYLDQPYSFKAIADHSHIFPAHFELGDRFILPFAAASKSLLYVHGESDERSAVAVKKWLVTPLEAQLALLESNGKVRIRSHAGGDEVEPAMVARFFDEVLRER